MAITTLLRCPPWVSGFESQEVETPLVCSNLWEANTRPCGTGYPMGWASIDRLILAWSIPPLRPLTAWVLTLAGGPSGLGSLEFFFQKPLKLDLQNQPKATNFTLTQIEPT